MLPLLFPENFRFSDDDCELMPFPERLFPDPEEEELEELEMLTSASLEKSVSELTRRADLRDSSKRMSSIFFNSVSFWNFAGNEAKINIPSSDAFWPYSLTRFGPAT